MSNKNDNLKNVNNYAKYSGLAFEMLGIIILGVWGGIKLDALIDTKPLFTVLLSLGGVALAIYQMIVKIKQ